LVVGLFRWLASKASGSKDAGETEQGSDTPSRAQQQPPPDQTEEQRVRKFLEALGQPPGSRPPPPVAPKPIDTQRAAAEARHRAEQARRALERRAVEPKKKIFTPRPQIPPLTTFPPPIPVESVKAPLPALPASPESAAAARRQTPIFEVQNAGARAAEIKRVGDNVDLAVLLKSPASLRAAIILREVFGPPRGLQPLDIVGSA
jgi:hypothetical protein